MEIQYQWFFLCAHTKNRCHLTLDKEGYNSALCMSSSVFLSQEEGNQARFLQIINIANIQQNYADSFQNTTGFFFYINAIVMKKTLIIILCWWISCCLQQRPMADLHVGFYTFYTWWSATGNDENSSF